MASVKTIVVHSGGLDSSVLLHHLMSEGHTVSSLSVNYGQRHAKELKCAAVISQRLGIPHEVADLRAIAPLLAGSSLTSPDIPIPEGHYAEDNMKSTVVPNRNMILLSIAAGWAISQKADAIAYAAHSGDHAIYPDCRTEFADAMRHAISIADWHKVDLIRPFVTKTKADIVRLGAELKVPFADTWSCYKGESLHCGRCGTCIERREAFHLAGVSDPTPYADDAPSVGSLIQSNWKITISN